MKNDLLLLTLLYAVACTAFIGAINARGPARVVLSYFLAILTLCAAVFHTSQLVAGGDLGKAEVVVAPPPTPEPVKPPEPPAGPDTSDLNGRQERTQRRAGCGPAYRPQPGFAQSGRRSGYLR
jgi:hypothetical protein